MKPGLGFCSTLHLCIHSLFFGNDGARDEPPETDLMPCHRQPARVGENNLTKNGLFGRESYYYPAGAGDAAHLS